MTMLAHHTLPAAYTWLELITPYRQDVTPALGGRETDSTNANVSPPKDFPASLAI